MPTLPLILALVLSTAAPPPDVSFTIRFPGGSNRFRVGEVIPLELIFRASVAGKYSYSTASYDRSGRLEMERFEVTPEGRDPPYHFYHDSFAGFIGGGLSDGMPLGLKPVVLQRNLNEWVALDQPGHYSVKVVSPRVLHQELTSNTLEFDVVAADAVWQTHTLNNAVAVLDSPTSSDSQREAAEATLRFLGPADSVRELVRQLTKPGSAQRWNFVAVCTAHEIRTLS